MAQANALVIEKALYGIFSDSLQKDITAKLAAHVKDGSLKVAIDNSFVGEDPAPFRIKESRVTYVYDGARKTACVPENGTLAIPPAGAESADKAHTLVIEEARYGIFSDSLYKDITAKLVAQVKDGCLNVAIDNAFVGEDPARGQVKESRVTYVYNGVRRTARVPENGTLVIPTIKDYVSAENDHCLASCEIGDEGYLRQITKTIKAKRKTGEDFKIVSARLIHAYTLSIKFDYCCREFQQNLGADADRNGKVPAVEDLWSFQPERKGGFRIPVEGSSSEETCHQCAGAGQCPECGGEGIVDCTFCNRQGYHNCTHCQGTGKIIHSERREETCLDCGGRGVVRYSRPCVRCGGTGRHPETGNVCPACLGSCEDSYYYDEVRCDRCGGNGRIYLGENQRIETCGNCGGTGKIKCNHCNGRGTISCSGCGGSGKCSECKGLGKALYTWYCVQKEISLCSSQEVLFDNDFEEPVDIGAKKAIKDINVNDGDLVGEWMSSHDECAAQLCPSYVKSCQLAKTNENDTASVVSVFETLWENYNADVPNAIAKKIGKGYQYRLENQRYMIRRSNAMIRVSFSDYGEHGTFYVSSKGNFIFQDTNRVDVARENYWREKREAEERKKREEEKLQLAKARRTLAISRDIHLATALAVIGLPFFFGVWVPADYLKAVFTPALVMGIVTYLAVDYIMWYFYVYVWLVAEKGSRGWVLPRNQDVIWLRRFFRLLWILFPIALLQGLNEEIPTVAQQLTPLVEWFDRIPEAAWYSIVAIGSIKVFFVIMANRWDWSFTVKSSGVILLAASALALATWPELLPEGMWLRDASMSAVSVVSMPIRYLGMVIVFPLELIIALGGLLTGLVGLLIVRLVVWTIHLFG